MDTLESLRLARLRQLRELQAKAARMKAGVLVYMDDPVGFARDLVDWRGEGLADYQLEAIRHLPTSKRVCVRSCHGAGKTTVAAVTVLWFALTRDAAGTQWKIVTTASAWRQLIHYLWPEIHKWAGRIDWSKVREGGNRLSNRELLHLHIRLLHGEAFAAASANPALIEGAHADSLLFMFDEAKAIPNGTWDAAEGALSTGDAYALAISTPGEPNGRFYDIQSRKPGYEDWHTIFVPLDKAIEAGRVNPDWADQRKKQWGETSSIYINRVLGEFAAADEDSVIPLSWAEKAVERWHAWVDADGETRDQMCRGRRVVGVDVARFGTDDTVFAVRQGQVVQELRVYSKADTMETVGRALGATRYPQSVAVVDVIGIGAGVVDRLREQGNQVMAFNAAAKDKNWLDRSGELSAANIRSAAWWTLRELLDPAFEPMLCLPDDDLLLGDLAAPHYRVLSGGVIQVESKDDILKRIGRSTDRGDAVVQCMWHPGHPSAGGDDTTFAYNDEPDGELADAYGWT